MKTLHTAIVVALVAFGSSFLLPAATAAAPLSSKELQILEHTLQSTQGVRAVVGTAFDIVRVEPVTYRSHQYVVDLATRDRSIGLRALVDLSTGAVLESRQLDPAHILFTTSDVADAFALVRNLPSVRARLGATLALYRASDSLSTQQMYRVEGLVVRSTARRDPCEVHRCIELLFHAPQGYVAGLHVLVDLSAGRRLDGPAGERASITLPRQMRPLATHIRLISSPQTAASPPLDCREIRFATVSSSWNICWHYVTGHGLVVGPASYKRQAGAPALNVIGDARVDEIFVPYATGDPRFFDTSFDFPLAPIAPGLCLKGTLFDGGLACLETRDRDIDWLSPCCNVPTGRRGEEAVLWNVLYAANYLYIMQWGFRDDGTFWGRVGVTGQNLPGIEFESHAHDYVWRIVPHLGGRGNSVNYVGVNEPISQLTAPDITTQILHPTGIVWNPQRFDQLEAYAPGLTNGRGHTTAYRLLAQPNTGLAHHQEPFTQADLWATEGDPLDIDAIDLPLYAKEHTSLANTDIALWYRGSFRHQPRDEDGFYDSGGNFIGTTHTVWTGFIFMPRNLFDQSPFF